ncbi:MAG TPA: hypothetical protein VHJ34_09555 [Actinomycetota bacterium]|nr:hypothetical protein [Actinomycetota bacterium]
MTGASIALVHHANQHLVCNGYDNRDGIETIARGYERVLAAHVRERVPLGLHLSGTLVEALAWWEPRTLDVVRRACDRGVATLVGGAYGENVMPLFSDAHNRAQLHEMLRVYDDLLGCDVRTVDVFWVPERVWDERLAATIADTTLPNGGYRAVLLDDRLVAPPGPARAALDAAAPYGGPGPPSPFRMTGTGLVVLPIAAELRYRVPPRAADEVETLAARLGGARRVVVYGDDLERVAGVGGWTADVADYERFVARLARGPAPGAASIADACAAATAERPVHAGCFHELASWGARDDYRGWADDARWAPYRARLERAEAAVADAAAAGADAALVELARKHVLASAHETAWQDPIAPGGPRAPAPWARALAAHAYAALPTVRAALSLAARAEPRAAVEDVDADGDDEVVLECGGAFAVVTPRYGGRVVHLAYAARARGVVIVGNHTDHWNFQEELNRYMDVPANHPGAFADAGAEHAALEVVDCGVEGAFALAELSWTSGPYAGGTKTLALGPHGVVACYRVPDGADDVVVTACLSPDYLRLLRHGRRGVRALGGRTWRGHAAGDGSAWVALGSNAQRWARPRAADPGHGFNVAVRAAAPHFDVALGWGAATSAARAGLLRGARAALHRAHAIARR